MQVAAGQAAGDPSGKCWWGLAWCVGSESRDLASGLLLFCLVPSPQAWLELIELNGKCAKASGYLASAISTKPVSGLAVSGVSGDTRQSPSPASSTCSGRGGGLSDPLDTYLVFQGSYSSLESISFAPHCE